MGNVQAIKNPVVVWKVKRELMDVLNKITEVKESNIGHFPYNQAVVKEVLQLHTIVSTAIYRAEERVTI